MTARWRARAADESGVVLLLALGFLAFIGVITVVLLSYTDTSARATTGLRPVRSAQFAADGAVEGAINRLRQFRPDATAPCIHNLYTVSPALNGQDIVLNCDSLTVVSASPTPTIDVTLTAVCPATRSAGCPANAVMITAVVRFAGSPPSVTPTIRSWSIRR